MTYLTTQTARPRMHRLKPAPSNSAALLEKLTKAAMDALTPAQREAFPSLSPADRMYVLTHKKWPNGASLTFWPCQKRANGAMGGSVRTVFVTLNQLRAAYDLCIKKMPRGTVAKAQSFTPFSLARFTEPPRAESTIRRAIEDYVDSGDIIEVTHKGKPRYRFADMAARQGGLDL